MKIWNSRRNAVDSCLKAYRNSQWLTVSTCQWYIKAIQHVMNSNCLWRARQPAAQTPLFTGSGFHKWEGLVGATWPMRGGDDGTSVYWPELEVNYPRVCGAQSVRDPGTAWDCHGGQCVTWQSRTGSHSRWQHTPWPGLTIMSRRTLWVLS